MSELIDYLASVRASTRSCTIALAIYRTSPDAAWEYSRKATLREGIEK